jgi:xanthine dehydrogenase accessory factor
MTGSTRELFEKLAALGRDGQAFAVATVIGRRAPVSAHLGDRAIVYTDGRMEGFVGGACSREIVRKQALEALAARQARLVSIRPDTAGEDTPDREHVVVPMMCASEGAVDVFIEPFVRARRLVVVGTTPVADALARSALTFDYDVVRVIDEREEEDLQSQSAAPGAAVASLASLEQVVRDGGAGVAVVVASQGHYDEEALEQTLAVRAAGADVGYVGLVASRKRGDTVRRFLEQRGVEGLEDVRHPAGLDLGARTPSEVALAILAEILQRNGAWHHFQVAESAQAPATATDPVCGMEVNVETARHTTEIGGRVYYFCCPHCRARFAERPEAFLSASR